MPTPVLLSFSLTSTRRHRSSWTATPAVPPLQSAETLLHWSLQEALGRAVSSLLPPPNGLEARWNPNPFSIYAMWSFWSWILVPRGSMKDLEKFLMVESSWFWISPVGWFWGERQCRPWDH
jgi:hypothetical protein